jgi:flagella basal body P-ring formation protein FlgA
MTRSILAALFALIAAGASAEPLQSLDTARPVLKAEATVTGPLVLVGDLVENAGIIAKVPIFRAPDLGTTGTVAADAVVDAVRAHALIGLDTAGITEVVVTRAARAIPAKEIEQIIARALAVQYNLGKPEELTVTFSREIEAMYVDPASVGEPRVQRISYDRGGRFDATLDIPTGKSTRGTLRVSGRALALIDVVTVARTVQHGTILKDADLLVERRPRTEVPSDAVTDRSQAVGLAARNTVQPGRPLRSTDLAKPDAVQRNQTVTLIYEAPGVTLTLRGKATDGGAEGDTISVINEQSKRSVQGVIVGPGRVMITTHASRIAANVNSASDNQATR